MRHYSTTKWLATTFHPPCKFSVKLLCKSCMFSLVVNLDNSTNIFHTEQSTCHTISSLLSFLVNKDPSLLMTTSELFIISMLCSDRMLPRRSGTGSATATEPRASGATLPLQNINEIKKKKNNKADVSLVYIHCDNTEQASLKKSVAQNILGCCTSQNVATTCLHFSVAH